MEWRCFENILDAWARTRAQRPTLISAQPNASLDVSREGRVEEKQATLPDSSRESSLGSVERRSGVGLIALSPPSPLPSSNEWTDPGTQDVTAILSQLRMSGER